MPICIIQINHYNERLSTIVNVWIELCQESNHFKIFITIVEFWKSVHSRNSPKVISEQLGTSLWHRRVDLIPRIYDRLRLTKRLKNDKRQFYLKWLKIISYIHEQTNERFVQTMIKTLKTKRILKQMTLNFLSKHIRADLK